MLMEEVVVVVVVVEGVAVGVLLQRVLVVVSQHMQVETLALTTRVAVWHSRVTPMLEEPAVVQVSVPWVH